MLKRILRTDAAAEYIGLSRSTLEKFRPKGEGPPFIRLAPNAVGYDVSDLDEWVESRKARARADSCDEV